MLARPAVSAAVANGNSWLLAYRRGERLCVAGYLQYEPASLWGHSHSHEQVRKQTTRQQKVFSVKHLQTFHIFPQHYYWSTAEREQDTVGPLFIPESLWKPHLPEPYQERHQLCGRRSVLSTIQPAGEQWQNKINKWKHKSILLRVYNVWMSLILFYLINMYCCFSVHLLAPLCHLLNKLIKNDTNRDPNYTIYCLPKTYLKTNRFQSSTNIRVLRLGSVSKMI